MSGTKQDIAELERQVADHQLGIILLNNLREQQNGYLSDFCLERLNLESELLLKAMTRLVLARQ